MDIDKIEQGLELKVPNLFRSKIHTTLDEDDTTGRPTQFYLRPGAFLLSEVVAALSTYHEKMERELTFIELKSGSDLMIDTKFKDFVKTWDLWLEQQG